MSSKKNKINSYKRLLSYLWPYKKLLILSVVFMLFVALSNLVVQVLEQKDLRMLYLVIVAILVTFFIRALTTFGHRYLMGYIGQAVIMDIRNVLYHHLQVLSISYYDRRRTGDIMSNLTNDIAANGHRGGFYFSCTGKRNFYRLLCVYDLSAMEADRALSHHRASGFLCD